VSAALHIATVCLSIAALAWACRFVGRGSRLAGLMFTAGLAIRAVGGGFLLAASYFGWPLMTSLQMGNGFWTLASDAQEYYRLAGLVAERWQDTITPGYVGPLAMWMRAAGVNPASPVLFGLVMYALSAVTLAAAFGGKQARAAERAFDLGIAALAFSPMLVYAGVFGLKDVFFTTLVVVMAVAYLTLLVAAPWMPVTRRTRVLAAAVGAVAVWFIAGMRAYFAILLWIAIAATYAGCLTAGIPSRRRAWMQAAVVLPALALVITFGAEGNYARFVRAMIASLPEAVLERRAPLAHGGIDELDRRREAIDDYGGNSMLSRRSETDVPAGTADSAAPSRLEGLAVGLSAVVVPSSLLGRVAGVDLRIGSSARLIADADTLVFDVIAAMILWMVIVNRRDVSLPPLLFGVLLAVLVALPLAYVMTNYGTLIRLRLLVAAPIWLVTLALAPRFAARRAPGRIDQVRPV